jgi:alpha-galactosidase
MNNPSRATSPSGLRVEQQPHQKSRTKISIVGGGSYNWGHKLLKDIAAKKELLAGTVVLHDINPVALDELGRLGRKIMKVAEADFSVQTTTDLPEALKGAEFVVVTITTGGLESMRNDLEIPLRHGIYQTVGDTVGPGGLSRALRNVPPLVEIARTMESVCPDAWMFNLTNPMTVLCRAVAKASSIKVIGLCHEVDSTRSTLMTLLGVTADELDLLVTGINHLPWFLHVRIQGQNGLPRIREYLKSGRPIPLKPSFEDRSPFQDHWKVKLALLDVYGYLPGAGDRHVAEFFPYFLTESTHFGADFDIAMTPIDLRERRTALHRDQVRHWLQDEQTVPIGRSREEFSDVIAALKLGGSVRSTVNIANRGYIDNLPREAVVEISANVSADGVRPLNVGQLPAPILSTVTPHVINQEMIADAALRGDRQLALQALVADPLVRDFYAAPKLLDELLKANAKWLPQF